MLCKRLFKQVVQPVLALQARRSASVLSALGSSPVLVSSNRDVYTNLALEHWLYTNLRFNQNDKDKHDKQRPESRYNVNHPIVLIWTDDPCVVIGRHQNPWVETTLGLVNERGIKLARRHSGGGCVYHDQGNINISIIGDRTIFDNRQENLWYLAKILEEKYGVDCEPNKRHDLIHTVTGKKMSGSAAKLGRFNSYHHFTLLVDTDTETMRTVIRQEQQEFIITNSSTSTRSNVINLKELNSELTVQQVISDLAQAYGHRYKDWETKEAHKENTKVEGDREEFESLRKFEEDLKSWKWTYGMSPKFKLEGSFLIGVNDDQKKARFTVCVSRGLFESFEIDCELVATRNLADVFSRTLVGTSFSYQDAMVNVVKMINPDAENIVSADKLGFVEQSYLFLFARTLLLMIHGSNF